MRSRGVFPEAADDFEVKSETGRPADGSGLLKFVTKTSTNWPARIGGVLAFKLAGNVEAHVVDVPIESSPSQTAAVSSAGAGATATQSSNSGGLILNLFLALLGGMILNLMPCVLPILSLKIPAVVNQQGKSAAVGRKHSLVYAGGCIGFVLGHRGVGRVRKIGDVGNNFKMRASSSWSQL